MSTTKIHRIVAMDICQSHPNKKAYQTDAYYAKLANQLLDDFKQLRPALIWVFCDCYLTRSSAAEKLIEERVEEARRLSDKMPDEFMRMFYAIMHSIFAYKIGPLALEPKEYVAALMRTKSSTEAILWLLERNYIPDIYDDALLSQEL